MTTPLDRLSEKAAPLSDVRLDKNYPLRGPVVQWDNTIMGLCNELLASGPEERETFAASLNDRQRAALGRYGHRAATLALRERSEQRLRTGLLASAFAEPEDFDGRETMVGIALHHHAASKLGLDPAAVFDDVAGFAPAHVAELFRSFGRREDVTLKAFGWSERSTPEGPEFRFG